MTAQATCFDLGQVLTLLDGLKQYGELLLVLSTIGLVVVTVFLWKSTRKAAEIAQVSHDLAKRLAELEVQPSLRVEVEEIAKPLSASSGDVEYRHKAKAAQDRFRDIKIENVGRGPARIQRVVYGDKEDRGAAEPGKCLLIQPGVFARFELDRLKELFTDHKRVVNCRIEYLDCGSPPTSHVYHFGLKLPEESGGDLLVVPGECE